MPDEQTVQAPGGPPDALSQAREREAATRQILEVISRSRNDEKPVFDAILRNAARLCSSAMARLHLMDDDGAHHRLVATWGEEMRSLEIGESWPMIPGNFIPRTIQEARSFHVEDLAETDQYRSGDPLFVRLVEEEGLRTRLTVPLMQGGRALGCIALSRREVTPFRQEEIAVVETFAAQAVIAIENVRQFRELQTRLVREVATRNILEVISQSRDDEHPVFDAIFESLMRLCNTPQASLFLVSADGDHLEFAASRGPGREALDRYRRENPIPLSDESSVFVRAFKGREPLHVNDVQTESRWRPGEDELRDAVNSAKIRSTIMVPLVSGKECLGVLAAYRTEIKPFTDDEIALHRTFAAQAVIAIENVRQFRELQTRLRREAANREILQVISRSRDDEQPVFDAILECASRLCEAPMAGLHIADETRSEIRLVAHRGVPESVFDLHDLSSPVDGPSTTARAVREGAVIHTEDLADDDLYRSGEPRRVAAVDAMGARTALVVPLIGNEVAIGCIWIFRREVRRYSDDEIALLQSFAAQAVIAIENVRQFSAIQSANAALEVRLEREEATKEILEVISRSRDDEQPVFDVILKNAARLCQSTMARLHLVEDDGQYRRLAAHWGDELRTLAVGEKFPMNQGHPISVSILESRVFHIEDIADTGLYRSGDPLFRRLVDEEGLWTLLTVPLLRDGRGFGCIALSRRERIPFATQDIELVKTFAAQAVIAIENVRQFRELQTRLEREAATRETLEVISRSRDDGKPVFDAILASASRLCHAPLAFLSLASDDRTRAFVAAHRGARSEFRQILENFDESIEANPSLLIVRPIVEAKAIRIADISDTDLYRQRNLRRVQLVEVEGVRSILVVPLMSGGQSIGGIVLYRREVDPFTDDEVALVQGFAAQAVIAIENVRQFKALEARTAEVQALNEGLEARVEEQVSEIERMGRLKRFMPPAVADAVVLAGDDKLLASHRALIATLFCDIRGFTAFCETAEPEETIEVLQTYHEEMGKLIAEHGAGVDHRMGDGIMVLFNDPLPCDDPAGDALRLALAMRGRMAELCSGWKRLGHRLGFGVGISLGYATVGMVGSEGRYEYTASGTAVNLAARLCDKAEDGEILLSARAGIAVQDDFEIESGGELALKGIQAPTEVFRVLGARQG